MTTKTYQQSNDVFTSFKIPPAKKMCAPTFPRVPVQKFSETALDNIRRERVERELDSNAKINDNFFINPKKFDALPPKINERPARFLDKEAIMLEQAEAQIKKFAKTESDSTSDYASQLSEEEQKLLKGYEESIQKQKEKEEKTKIDFELSLKETKKRPMDKYIEPQTTNQEVGWFHSKIDATAKFLHPHLKCAETAFQEELVKSNAWHPNKKKDAAAAEKK